MLHVRKFGWTKDVLIHQIENKTYEKYLMNQTNFDQTLPEKYKHQAKLAVKDHYTFDFLELAEEHSKYLPAPEVIAERLAIVKDLFEDEG